MPTVVAQDLGQVFVAPLDVHLPSGDVVRPDVLFVARANAGIVQDWIRGVPDLVVEVVSPAHAERDRAVKRARYERDGVPEYWIVDPGERSIEILRLADGRLRPAGYHVGDAALVSTSFPGLRIPLREVFP